MVDYEKNTAFCFFVPDRNFPLIFLYETNRKSMVGRALPPPMAPHAPPHGDTRQAMGQAQGGIGHIVLLIKYTSPCPIHPPHLVPRSCTIPYHCQEKGDRRHQIGEEGGGTVDQIGVARWMGQGTREMGGGGARSPAPVPPAGTRRFFSTKKCRYQHFEV